MRRDRIVEVVAAEVGGVARSVVGPVVINDRAIWSVEIEGATGPHFVTAGRDTGELDDSRYRDFVDLAHESQRSFEAQKREIRLLQDHIRSLLDLWRDQRRRSQRWLCVSGVLFTVSLINLFSERFTTDALTLTSLGGLLASLVLAWGALKKLTPPDAPPTPLRYE